MVICNLGMAEVAALIGTDTTASGTAFDYIAIGNGDQAGGVTDAAATDTTLQHELQREASVGTRVQTTVANDTFQLVKDSFSFAGSFQITECGVLNAASTGVLLSHGTFAAVAVTAADELKMTIKHQIKQGA